MTTTYSGTCPTCSPTITCGHCMSYRKPTVTCSQEHVKPAGSAATTYSGTCPTCSPTITCGHCMSYRR